MPDREHEGYGINSNRIRKLKEEGFCVILTFDNGIAAVEQVELAKKLGMTVIITDHHELQFEEDKQGNRTFKHPMVAGLSIKEENIEKLRQKLNDICKLTDEDIVPKIRIDERMAVN